MNKYENPEEKDSQWRAITVLKLEKRSMGWSPKRKKSVFIDDSNDKEIIQELKRVREADILTVYDRMEDRTMFIELKAQEREQFDKIYMQYMDSGGQIYYRRKKEGRKTHIAFMLDEDYGKILPANVPEKKSLF